MDKRSVQKIGAKPTTGREVVVVDSISGDGSVMSVLDRSPVPSGQAFYRLEAIQIR